MRDSFEGAQSWRMFAGERPCEVHDPRPANHLGAVPLETPGKPAPKRLSDGGMLITAHSARANRLDMQDRHFDWLDRRSGDRVVGWWLDCPDGGVLLEEADSGWFRR